MTPHDAREKQGMLSPNQDAGTLMAQPFEIPHYGDKHFCIRTLQGGEIDLWANRLEVTMAGALIAWATPAQLGPRAAELICFMLAAGQWTAAFFVDR
jgi:hypothetical protein